MELQEVKSRDQEVQFLQVNVNLNRNTPNYIRPLDHEIRAVFDPEQNKFFRHGECSRWILVGDEGEPAGRIAAFVNKKYRTKGDDVPVGGIGFFDCINNQQAADLLFDVAKHWLLQRGMEAMDGPINFGERDKWWGLVTEGFHEPLYGMNFNPPYYQSLFENYGFRIFFNQVCLGLDPRKSFPDKLVKRHDTLASDPAFSFRFIRKNELKKFAADFTTVYNKAWAGHGGAKEIRIEQTRILFQKMKPVMDERLIIFAYHHAEPIGMFVNLPELNQYFKHFNGRFGLLQKIHFLFMKMTGACKKITGIVFGIVPEFQGRGVDAYMILEVSKSIIEKTKYTSYEMQWIGDFNPKMINLAENLGETFRSRNLVTYRYLFNRLKEFKRHPFLV